MRVALCQINPTVGDFDHNRERIIAAVVEARHQGARWALFSELALSGYPPGRGFFSTSLPLLCQRRFDFVVTYYTRQDSNLQPMAP